MICVYPNGQISNIQFIQDTWNIPLLQRVYTLKRYASDLEQQHATLACHQKLISQIVGRINITRAIQLPNKLPLGCSSHKYPSSLIDLVESIQITKSANAPIRTRYRHRRDLKSSFQNSLISNICSLSGLIKNAATFESFFVSCPASMCKPCHRHNAE